MSTADYFILSHSKPNTFLLNRPKSPDENHDWLDGISFTQNVELPVQVRIKDTTVDCDPVDCFSYPFVVSAKFFQALTTAGVDNIDAYDAVLVNQKADIYIEGYKAINIIGLISAAGAKSNFTSEDRLINASFDGLEIDTNKTKNLLMFRLAEDVTRIVVHKSVKEYLEALDCFPELWFRDPSEFFSL
jgi:hypothetical protein